MKKKESAQRQPGRCGREVRYRELWGWAATRNFGFQTYGNPKLLVMWENLTEAEILGGGSEASDRVGGAKRNEARHNSKERNNHYIFSPAMEFSSLSKENHFWEDLIIVVI